MTDLKTSMNEQKMLAIAEGQQVDKA